MDKLQPLIKHRYWICFGLSVIFVVVGWWMASGAIATEIENGRKSVEGAFSKAKQGANDPNAKWVEGANERNKVDEGAFTAASTELRERQQNARQWPEAVRDEMKGIAYQGPITNHVSREKWASVYKDEIEALLAIVKPFEKGEGLVVVTPDRITHKPFDSWRFGPPQSKEIWDSQEDIWLLRSLLTSIASVNGDASRITESSVREIQRLWLRGGDPAATPSSSGGGGSMTGMGGMEGVGSMGGNLSMGGGAMSGGSGGTTTAASHPGKDFEGNSGSDILGEEFGPDSSNGSSGGLGGGGGGGGVMGSPPAGKGGFSSGMMGMMGGGGGGETAAPTEEKRYVHEVEGSYKTRAFLLDVMVRDDKLPELLAALTDSDFPVEIVRVEINATPGAGGSAGGLGGMSSMGGSSELSPGMSSGMGAGSSRGMMPGGMPGMGGMPSMSGGGGKGMMPPGADAGMGPSGMVGGLGSGLGSPGGASNPTGMESYQIAMADPLLISVRIGGLMTLYQSAQESDAAEQTAAAAATEATAVPPANPASTDGSTAVSPPDGTTTTTPSASEAPNGNTPAPPENSAPGAGTSDATPAAGNPAPSTEGAPAQPATTDPGVPSEARAPSQPDAATGTQPNAPAPTEGTGSGEGTSPVTPAPSPGSPGPQ